MQYALGIEKAVGEIDADFELFDELGAAELAHRLDDCLIVIVSAGEDVALHTGRDLLVNLVVVDLSETGTSPLPERPLREAQVATAAHLVNHIPRNCLVIVGHPRDPAEPVALRLLYPPTEAGFSG